MPRNPPDWDSVLPWERQKGETGLAWTRFVIGREMGPARSLQKIAEALTEKVVTPQRLHQQATRWNWFDRWAAYDAEQDRIAREAFEQRRLEAKLLRADVYDETMLAGFRVMAKFRREVESAQLDKLSLARKKVKQRIELPNAEDGTPRWAWVEAEDRAITDLVAPMVPAIAEAARGQRLDYGEATDRREADVNLKAPDLVRALAHLLRDRLTDVEFDAVEEELAGLLGDNGVPSPSAAEG